MGLRMPRHEKRMLFLLPYGTILPHAPYSIFLPMFQQPNAPLDGNRPNGYKSPDADIRISQCCSMFLLSVSFPQD